MKIAVAGTGYVGLSVALLLSQHNEVHALDIVPEKVELLNEGKSPIVDKEITAFLNANKSGERPLNFRATLDPEQAYTGADYAIVATPTNYDAQKNYFDTSSVEAAIAAIRKYDKAAWIVIKSTIPVGYTQQLRERLADNRILFSPNSFARATPYMTICIQAVSWQGLHRVMQKLLKPLAHLSGYSPMVLIQRKRVAPTQMGRRAFPNW